MTVGAYADVFNVRKEIAGEIAIKLTHEEIGILRRCGTGQKM